MAAAGVNLGQLGVDQNNLTSIDVTQFPNLTTLVMGFNPLTNPVLDLTNNPNLSVLLAEFVNISTIMGLSQLTDLVFVRLNGNNLTSLIGLENAINLRDLNANSNSITDVPTFSNWTQLTDLNLSSNPVSLTSVDISQNINLTTLTRIIHRPPILGLIMGC